MIVCVFVNLCYGTSDASTMPISSTCTDGFTVRDLVLWDFPMQYSEYGFSFGYCTNEKKVLCRQENQTRNCVVEWSKYESIAQVRYMRGNYVMKSSIKMSLLYNNYIHNVMYSNKFTVYNV